VFDVGPCCHCWGCVYDFRQGEQKQGGGGDEHSLLSGANLFFYVLVAFLVEAARQIASLKVNLKEGIGEGVLGGGPLLSSLRLIKTSIGIRPAGGLKDIFGGFT
jgi:hypothetical protein